jgi:hypothetical protein
MAEMDAHGNGHYGQIYARPPTAMTTGSARHAISRKNFSGTGQNSGGKFPARP